MKKAEAERRARRKEWWQIRWMSVKLYFFSLLGVAFILVLPDLNNGIQGVKLYVPNWTEIGVALAVAYLALLLDEQLGDRKVSNPQVMLRKRKNAFLAGIAATAIISKFLGG